MIKRQTILVILFLLVLAAAGWNFFLHPADAKTAGSKSVREIETLCHQAAHEQYAGLLAREPWVSNRDGFLGGPHFKRALHLYRIALDQAGRMNPAGMDPRDRQIVSRLDCEAAWFAHQIHAEKQLAASPETLIAASLKLDPSNTLALYEQGILAESLQQPGARQLLIANCRKAVKINPHFPEAWLQIRLASLPATTPAQIAQADVYERNFVSTLNDYNPALFYFDPGYPAQIVAIFMPPDGKPLRRIIYRADAARFDITDGLP